MIVTSLKLSIKFSKWFPKLRNDKAIKPNNPYNSKYMGALNLQFLNNIQLGYFHKRDQVVD